MNTEQIIKAMECCSGIAKCIDCPYTKVDKCAEKSARDTIALIKEQQAEIRGLKTALETLRGIVEDYEHRNENLKRENKYLRESLADEREHKEDMRAENKKLFDEAGNQSVLWKQHFESLYETAKETVKADTVKKMQERIAEAAFYEILYHEERHLVNLDDIDQIAKEILEGTK